MNKDNSDIIDYPKIKCPFVREKIKGHYVVTPQIEEGYEWVFEDPGVKAVDKLHGTNLCCMFDKGILIHIDNRSTRVLEDPCACLTANMSSAIVRMIEGVLHALERGWIENDFTGRVYGELIGPTINGNLHQMVTHYFVPFDYLQKKCHWKSWVNNKYPKNFESLSNWFKELPSLFSQRMKANEGLAEGLVFYHPDGRLAKLRRDMFESTTPP